MIDIDKIKIELKSLIKAGLTTHGLSGKNLVVRLYFKLENLNLISLINKNSDLTQFYFSKPEKKESIFAIDSIQEFSTSLNSSLSAGLTHFTSESEVLSNFSDSQSAKFPLFLGSEKFSDSSFDSLWGDFDKNNWFLPKFMFIQNQDETSLIYSLNFIEYSPVQIASDYKLLSGLLQKNDEGTITPGNIKIMSKNIIEHQLNDWITAVLHAKIKILNDDLRKIVLSRKKSYYIPEAYFFPKLITNLEKLNPSCGIFFYKKGETEYFAASPEKLIISDGKNIVVDALAGSISRDSDTVKDDELANTLLNSSKNIEEHNYVVEYLEKALQQFGISDITIQKTSIKKLQNIQHLHTVLTGKLSGNDDLLNVIEEIFPTPALCGYPKLKTRELIPVIENFDRGLFGGIIGWINEHNAAELFVGIRGGAVKEKQLTLFAGCGLVESSNPNEEFEETEIKFAAITSAFEYEN